MIGQFLGKYEKWVANVPQGTHALLRHIDNQSPRAVRIDADSHTRDAQLTIWDSGEADLVVIDLMSGETVTTEQRHIRAEGDIEQLLHDVCSMLNP